jgi:protoporphyrinogen oxidase
VTRSAIVIGAGFTGLAAAYELACEGVKVRVFEAADDVGGLASTFDLGSNQRLEKFYHHWFSSDSAVLDLLREIGVGDGIDFRSSRTGLYHANSLFRLASPLDLLRFTPLPFLSRVRTGLMAVRARRITDWRSLEGLSAQEWIIRHAGKRSFEVIWGPLLQGKFGAEAPEISAVWFWNKLKLRGSSRDKMGGEQLVYFRGGFSAALAALRSELKRRGVEIQLNSRVRRVLVRDGVVRGVELDGRREESDLVLATLPLPQFLEIAPDLPASYRSPAAQIRFLGNVCLILRLRQSLSDTYWLNVADPSFPFVAVIEHTNFDDLANYGGQHIAYLSKYMSTSDALFSINADEFLAYSLPYLQRIFPRFSRDWIIAHHVWRAHYSQPVITKHYSRFIPAHQTPIKNLWLATMAQVYPEDRGTNYAVQHGREVARRMLAS